jgi:hypothetical protein
MKTAYDYRANALKMSTGIDFDGDYETAEELRLQETKQIILQKLRVVFAQHDKQKRIDEIARNRTESVLAVCKDRRMTEIVTGISHSEQ